MATIYPVVTCLCPTYGRFDLLQDAVACFLLQRYSGIKQLLILNDAEVPIYVLPEVCAVVLPDCRVKVLNDAKRWETLGHKRQRLLELAESAVVAHWDDDDVYLPWHLQSSVSRLCELPEKDCVKHRKAWWGVGKRPHYDLRGPSGGGIPLEGQMVFRREAALRLGGYSNVDSGQAWHLLKAFIEKGLLGWVETDSPSYVYRWGNATHISHLKTGARFADRNKDFGEGKTLLPETGDLRLWAKKRLAPQFSNIVNRKPNHLSETERKVLNDCIGAGS